MRADGEGMKEVKESHRGMVDGCRWSGGGVGYRFANVWVNRKRQWEMIINSQVFLGLGEVTKIEPLRQCLLNCRNAYTQEGEAEQVKRQGNYMEESEG